MIQTHRTARAACLACGEVLDAATNAQLGVDRQPHDGAIAICRECSHVMAFDGAGGFRELTEEELREVMNLPEVRKALVVTAEWNSLRRWHELRDRLAGALRKLDS